jgi:peroxiredoxin
MADDLPRSPALLDARQLPELHLTDRHGQSVALSGLLASVPAVLYFLRTASCPACLAHARRLVAARSSGRVQPQVVLVTPGGAGEASAVERKVAVRSAGGLPEGVVVLASGDAHQAAGFGRTLMLQHSGTLIVDTERKIRYALTAALPMRSYDEPELLAALASLPAPEPSA